MKNKDTQPAPNLVTQKAELRFEIINKPGVPKRKAKKSENTDPLKKVQDNSLLDPEKTDTEYEVLQPDITFKDPWPIPENENLPARDTSDPPELRQPLQSFYNAAPNLTENTHSKPGHTHKSERDMLIKKTEEKYRNLFEHASDAIIIFSFDGRIQEFNNTACRLSGYSRREFATLKISDVLVGDLKISLNKYRSILTGRSVTVYRQFITRDGVMLDMEIRVKLLKDGNIIAFGRDMTDLNKNEEETRRAIERYEILSKATSDTIWDWDIKNDIITYNDGISKMFGYKPDEIDNAITWWEKNIHPDDNKSITQILNNTFNEQLQTVQLEYRYRCADNSYKNILDRAFIVYDDAGLPIRMIGAMQDVTKEKEHERNIAITIIEAQEKERMGLGMELHDNVNQLLSATLLYLAMAKKSSQEGKEVSELLNSCIKYINDAIDDIRNLSHRLTPYSKGEASLKEVLEQMFEPMQISDQFEINLQVDDFDDTLVDSEIKTNLYRIIQQHMTNILKHAMATKVDVDVRLTHGTIKLNIADNGIGFNAKAVKQGIGLENIKRRTELFSGICILNTAPGKGCELTIEIPLH